MNIIHAISIGLSIAGYPANGWVHLPYPESYLDYLTAHSSVGQWTNPNSTPTYAPSGSTLLTKDRVVSGSTITEINWPAAFTPLYTGSIQVTQLYGGTSEPVVPVGATRLWQVSWDWEDGRDKWAADTGEPVYVATRYRTWHTYKSYYYIDVD